MKIYRSIIIIALTLTVVLMACLPAGATCTKFGYFVRVVTFEGTTYAMLREDFTDGNYYQVQANDAQVAAAIYQAYKGGSRAYVRTTESTCPTDVEPGTNRIDIGIIDRVGLGY